MTNALLINLTLLVLALLVLQLWRLLQARRAPHEFAPLAGQILASISRLEHVLHAELRESRSEATQSLRENREEQARTQSSFRTEMGAQLREMRATVDEKLQATLNERLGHSFAQVSHQLESVQKGLGEMQSLAGDVGSLKKVLSNVKTRGVFGEVQLAALLEQMLAPAQYSANVKTKKGSNDLVEFAIRLPGAGDNAESVWLPIDAKFPKDAYENYSHAVDSGETARISQASQQFESTLLGMAKDIRSKYIDPPHTTDFAILFLPFESIYAEVVRRDALMETLRNQYKVTVAGPAILGALLNSLQMGFRTLAIQQRSSEVWQVLGSVKTEFGKFGDLLRKVQKNVSAANLDLDQLISTRTRQIERKLQGASAPLGEALDLCDGHHTDV